MQDIYLKLSALETEAPVQNGVAFLYRLGSNLMLDRLRQQRRAAARDGAWRDITTHAVDGQDVADDPPADEQVADRQRLTVLLVAIEALPDPQRRAFRLHKLEGLSQAETAAALGVSLSSVEKYLRSALQKLARRLG